MKNQSVQSEREEQKLRGAVSWQKKPLPPQEIAGLAQGYLDRKKNSFRRASGIMDAWQQILPPTLRQRCRPIEYNAGTLTIEVLAGPYMHQMKIMQKELIQELRRICPKSGLRKIRLIPMIQ